MSAVITDEEFKLFQELKSINQLDDMLSLSNRIELWSKYFKRIPLSKLRKVKIKLRPVNLSVEQMEEIALSVGRDIKGLDNIVIEPIK